MQPMWRQVPPSLSASTSATFKPSWEALIAAGQPPIPPPRIATSKSVTATLQSVGGRVNHPVKGPGWLRTVRQAKVLLRDFEVAPIGHRKAGDRIAVAVNGAVVERRASDRRHHQRVSKSLRVQAWIVPHPGKRLKVGRLPLHLRRLRHRVLEQEHAAVETVQENARNQDTPTCTPPRHALGGAGQQQQPEDSTYIHVA